MISNRLVDLIHKEKDRIFLIKNIVTSSAIASKGYNNRIKKEFVFLSLYEIQSCKCGLIMNPKHANSVYGIKWK